MGLEWLGRVGGGGRRIWQICCSALIIGAYVSDVSHARRRSVRLHLHRGTFWKRKKIGAEAPVRHRSILALIYSGPRRTPHTPQGRQYFRVWLGHQFVIKSSPPTVAIPPMGPGPVSLFWTARRQDLVSHPFFEIYGARISDVSGVEEGTDGRASCDEFGMRSGVFKN